MRSVWLAKDFIKLMLVFGLGCPWIVAQNPCASPLPDWLLPSEENYQHLHEASSRRDLYDRLHYIPLGNESSNRYLSIGGQQREWYESFSTPPLGNGPADPNGYLLQRYMLHLDLHLNNRVRFFVDFKGDLENGRVGGPRPDVDEDRGDLHQAFVEITLSRKVNRNWILRVGRQEMVYGSGRLVDMREGPNVRLSFDGAKLTYCSTGWRVDAFAARPVLNRLSAFDDVPSHRTNFAGIYSTHPLRALFKSNVDLYYFAFDQKNSLYVRGAAHEQRHTAGARFWRTSEGWDYDWEFIDQFGRFGSKGIKAWGVSTNTGYNFNKKFWQPRVGLKTGIASGDSGVTGQDLGTLNPLFASLHYFGEEGLAGPSNFYDLRPEVDFHPRKNLHILLNSDWFWRHRLNDGIYLPGPVLLVLPNGFRARYIGNQDAVEIGWNPSHHWTTAVYWSHFFNGQFLNEATRAQNLNYVAGWITFHF